MAINKCTDCNGDVSDKAKACPHCGAPVKKTGNGCALIFLVIITLWLIGKLTDSSSASMPTRQSNLSTPTQEKWFAGGTLHEATMGEWKNATYENRLATSADFVTALMKAKGEKIQSLEKMRRMSEQFEKAMSDVATEPGAATQKASSVAAAIGVLMQQ